MNNPQDSRNSDHTDPPPPRFRHSRWVTLPPEGWVDGAGHRDGSQPRSLSESLSSGTGEILSSSPRPESLKAAPRQRLFWFRRLFRDVVLPLTIAFIVAMFAQATVAKPYQIPSGSMLPTIQLQDRILADRMIYRLHGVERGDVIVFTPPAGLDQSTPYVKRVVGLPGDRVEVHNGKTLVNGEELVVPSATTPTYTRTAETVPDGMLFVLGDNRNESSDSHIWGYVPVDNIIGRADVVYWPLKNIRLLGL